MSTMSTRRVVTPRKPSKAVTENKLAIRIRGEMGAREQEYKWKVGWNLRNQFVGCNLQFNFDGCLCDHIHGMVDGRCGSVHNLSQSDSS